MEEQEFQNTIKDILEMLDIFEEIEGIPIEIKNISTFDDVGLLTKNKGLVIKLTNGSEFQLTIVKSK